MGSIVRHVVGGEPRSNSSTTSKPEAQRGLGGPPRAIRQIRTRPYRPQTNGKVERWIRTVLSESHYREAFGSSSERAAALARFVDYYDDERPHLGIGARTPRQRLAEKLAA